MTTLQVKRKRKTSQDLQLRNKQLTRRAKNKSEKAPEYTNVNSYKHFLKVPTTNQDYIHWAFNLRQYKNNQPIKDHSSSVPQVYYKTIQGEKQKHTNTQLNGIVNMAEYEHLGMHRIGSHASAGLLRFETGLRKDQKLPQQLKNKERDWKIYAKKDRGEQPKLIASKSLKKKFIQDNEKQSAMDGHHRYPKFTEKLITVRNYQQFRHMIKGEVHLPSIGWQTGLRNY